MTQANGKTIPQKIIKKRTIQGCCNCFIRRIGSSNRKGKKVTLIGKNKMVGPLSQDWINGALSTTALRARPNKLKDDELCVCNIALKSEYKSLQCDPDLKTIIKSLRCRVSNSTSVDQDCYDKHLRIATDELTKLACNKKLRWGFGRSQKFFNILFKYWFTVAKAFPDRLKEFDLKVVNNIEHYLHVPVDSVVLKFLKKKHLYWGWNMHLKDYMCIQKSLRQKARAADCSPIAFETVEIW